MRAGWWDNTVTRAQRKIPGISVPACGRNAPKASGADQLLSVDRALR